MHIDDETVRASLAARDLLRLYDAYRATARAQIATIQQVQRHLKRQAQQEPDAALPTKLAVAMQYEGLAWHIDAVYAERREQVRRRLFELQSLPELP